MKKARCPACGKTLELDTLFCPRCGAAIFKSDLPAACSGKKAHPALSFVRKLPLQNILPVAAVVAAVVIAVALSWDNLTGLLTPSDTIHQLSSSPSAQAATSSTNLTLPSGGSGFIPTSLPVTILPVETIPVASEPLVDISWYTKPPQYMSYEEYFSEDRPIYGQYDNTSWTGHDGNTYTINNQLQIFRDGKLIYTVPDADRLPENQHLLIANGIHAYLADEYMLTRISLLTGKIDRSFSLAKPFCAVTQGADVIYFAAASQDYILIQRYYIPTETLDTLYQISDASTPDTWFSLSLVSPYSSLGTVTWTMLNPQMHFFLYSEMRNPDSKYRTIGNLDFSAYWEDPWLLNTLSYDMGSVTLLRAVYEDTGIQPLLCGTYRCVDGSYTEDLGIVDECWFGSGFPHDHWNPEKTEFIPPTVYSDSPTPLSVLTPPAPEIAEQIRSETRSDGNDVFYAYRDNDTGTRHIKNQDGAIVGPPMKFSGILCNTRFYSYYISPSNSIVRLSLDGTVTEIYTAQNEQELQHLSYEKGVLVFVEGDTAMALDVVDCTVKPLFRHPGLHCVEWDWDDSGNIYFVTVLGMQVDAYLLDPATGKLQRTAYRN